MKKHPRNYNPEIHNDAYDCEYQSIVCGAESMISDVGRQKESLDGYWNCQIDQYDTCLRARWFEEADQHPKGGSVPVDYDFDRWKTMKIPSCWNMHAEKFFYYEGSFVFTRTFRYLKKSEQRVFIKFGAVNYEAKVFLNKRFIGMHKGGSTPFYFEVTDNLQEWNRILVVADNTRKRENVPERNTDWFNYGGIYRSVEIIRLPSTFISNFHIRLIPDGTYKKIGIQIHINGPEQSGKAVFRIDEIGLTKEISILDGFGELFVNCDLQLWCPETPKLYDVTIRFGEDTVHDRIGFREIRSDGINIFLNGCPIFLKGICTHEESVVNGKSMTENEIRENFCIAKEMNCNFMRLAHYPHSEAAARIADEVGMLLWEEIPVYWSIDFSNSVTYADAENQLSELVIRDRNRASVIIWSVGNENADTDERFQFMKSLAIKAKSLDPERLVSAACLVDRERLIINDRLSEYLDIIGLNEYYGWYEPDFRDLISLVNNSNPDKPIIITEFGADALAGARGTRQDMGTEDCQKEIYTRQICTLKSIPYIKGICPWILYDFRCPRRTGKWQGEYNRKGLLSADKTYKKLAFGEMKEFYSGLESHALPEK